VVGLIERDGIVKCQVVSKFDLTAKRLTKLVREKVDTDRATLFTDEYGGYAHIHRMMPHEIVVHSQWYVRGSVHTNNIESFWAIVKRGIIGQFHKVSLQYLPRYINEFCYRFNHRNNDDLFDLTIQRGLGVC
jgi:transposase-like protein